MTIKVYQVPAGKRWVLIGQQPAQPLRVEWPSFFIMKGEELRTGMWGMYDVYMGPGQYDPACRRIMPVCLGEDALSKIGHGQLRLVDAFFMSVFKNGLEYYLSIAAGHLNVDEQSMSISNLKAWKNAGVVLPSQVESG